jgi:transposase
MRKSFDALSGLVQECFGQDLLAGHLFLYFNRRRDRIEILAWEEGGIVIWYKRLEIGMELLSGMKRQKGRKARPGQGFPRLDSGGKSSTAPGGGHRPT